MVQKLENLVINNKELENKVANLKSELRRPSSPNQDDDRIFRLKQANMLIDEMRFSDQCTVLLATFFIKNPDDNLYYLKEERISDIITKMVIERHSSLILRELELNLD